MKKLSESFNEITVARGEKFQIELKENPSSGYRWRFQVVSGKVSKVDDKFERDEPRANVVGGLGTRRMTYNAYGGKDITIRALYKRSWEKDSDAAGNLTLKVKIR